MSWLIVVAGIILLLFSFVVLFGAPYLPVLSKQQTAAFDLLNLPKGATLYELGCGDGRVVLEAAKRGYNVVGYELNPILAVVCWLRVRKYKNKAKIIWGNFWRADISEADGIFVFLLQKYMSKLDKKIIQGNLKKVKLVSFAFTIPNRKATKIKDGVYLYSYGN